MWIHFIYIYIALCEAAHQTEEIDSLRPLSSTDGAPSISSPFCHANVPKDDKGGSFQSKNSERQSVAAMSVCLLFCHTNVWVGGGWQLRFISEEKWQRWKPVTTCPSAAEFSRSDLLLWWTADLSGLFPCLCAFTQCLLGDVAPNTLIAALDYRCALLLYFFFNPPFFLVTKTIKFK